MAVFKCKMCGGTLNIKDGMTVCECEYCGTTQTVSKSDNEQTINMLNRATHFRQQCEFDKAMEIYEKLLDNNNSDSEIYWQIVLCRYGIEYVDDPLTKKKIPTCHRTQYNSILEDADYLEALACADSQQATLYRNEAEYIDNIQKRILEISNKEDPFDIFICYKESDENGKRTPDSVLAQDLYYQLEHEGFKVFFSRITLEGKLGTAYEPYIFAALNSAKVMVVVGTKQEYFNAVWVKNEWSRFLMLMQKDKTKTLIPAYKNIDPYDLPEELSYFQAQDMSKLGFMQDLIRGIKKITNSENESKDDFEDDIKDSSNIKPLLKRAYMFLEDHEWNNANSYSEKILDQNPECAEAYLIKLMIDLETGNVNELVKRQYEFKNHAYYKKAIKYADSKFKEKLEHYSNERDYNEALIAFNKHYYTHAYELFQKIASYKDSEEKVNECIYLNALNECNNKNYTKASEIFNTIPNYKDSKERAKECLYLSATNLFSQELFSDAEFVFNKLSDYKDSREMADKCHEKSEIKEKDDILNSAIDLMNSDLKPFIQQAIEKFHSIQGWKNADELANECEKKLTFINQHEKELVTKRKKIKIIKITSILAGCIIIAAGTICFIVTIPIRKYNDAMKYWKNGEYHSAYTIFSEIPNYKDSSKAIKLLSIQDNQITDYNEKIKILEELGNFKNAADLLMETKYNKACELMNLKKYADAIKLLNDIKEYGDPNGLQNKLYEKAIELEEDHDFAKAAECFLILNNFKDSQKHIKTIYDQACTYMKDKKYNYAAAVFMKLGDYEDSQDNLKELYDKCIKYIDEEKYTDAIPVLKNLVGYQDSKDQLNKIHQKALDLMNDKKYDKATKIFDKLGNMYYDSGINIQKIEDMKKQDKYNKAIQLASDGDYSKAIKIFEELDNYSDSKNKIKELENKQKQEKYDKGKDLIDNGNYDEAIKIFSDLESYSDSKYQIEIAKSKKIEEEKANEDYSMQGKSGTVNIDNGYLNIRESAHSDSSVKGKLYNGDVITIVSTSQDGNWYRITYGNITGYVAKEYIKTSIGMSYGSVFKKGEINCHGGIVSGLDTSYICEGGKYSTVRKSLGDQWHVTAKNMYYSMGIIWYELWDSDDGDYYGWVDSNYIDFYN